MTTPIQKQKIFFALGTVNTLTYFEETAESAVQEAVNRVGELHNRLSVFDENSEISRINQQAGMAPVRVSPDTYRLISDSMRYARWTDGAFDITTGVLSCLWKKAIRSGDEPQQRAIDHALSLTGFRDILMHPLKRSVMLRKVGQKLDLGAIAKGYAADEVRRILQAHQVDHAIINLGGTVITLGEHTVGLQDPFQDTGVSFAAIRINGKAVVSSGTYEQCRQQDDKLMHHLIDPTTGHPADTDLTAVTLIGDNAEELDALATAVLIQGMDKGMTLLRRRKLEGVFITRQGRIYATKGLKHQLMTDHIFSAG
ncbi:MAG: FAD:protein FMN transferase [Clostridia bacterium]|nr:FAD:protein FMN transferase [Clostridia bacterium]